MYPSLSASLTLIVLGILAPVGARATPPAVPEGKKLGTILSNDINNILFVSSGTDLTAQEYKRAVDGLLDAKPHVLAQNVGTPETVIYRTKVATSWDKYFEGGKGVQAEGMRKLLSLGTDPLTLTIQACRARGVLVLADYRMNAEDFYQYQLDMSDFTRAHKDWAIKSADCLDRPAQGPYCLDPAIPGVYQHRMEIFREVANAYDIDGIEFDFMRWNHQISNPHKNHPILTRMVRETRTMLDEIARRKGRNRLLLVVRVGHTLAGPSDWRTGDVSCKDIGLDVKTWVEQGLVDCVCPSRFWPRLPGLPNIKEFVDLTRGTKVGVYPTVFPYPKWMEDGPDKGPIGVANAGKLRRYRDDVCKAALQSYTDGADGISTYNWVPHHQPGMVAFPDRLRGDWGLGNRQAQMIIHTKLGSPAALRRYLQQQTVLPGRQ